MICRLPEARPGAGLAVPEVPLRHRNWARHRTHTTHAAADPSTDSAVEPVTKLVRADSARAATASSNDGDAITRPRERRPLCTACGLGATVPPALGTHGQMRMRSTSRSTTPGRAGARQVSAAAPGAEAWTGPSTGRATAAREPQHP